MRRVAVTGLGMVSPLGHTVQASWRELLAGHSGIGFIESFDASQFTTQIAAEVRHYPRAAALLNRAVPCDIPLLHFAYHAAQEALSDARLNPQCPSQARWAFISGSGLMTLPHNYWVQLVRQAVDDANRYSAEHLPTEETSVAQAFSASRTNLGICLLAEALAIRGYVTSVNTACASGGQAIGLGARAIRDGRAEVVLAGGFDSMINPTGLASFALLGAMSTQNDDPPTACRPFAKDRDGFVLGEGAAYLLLEEWQHAEERGARIYAELAGEGNTLSSYRITDSHPSGDGPRQAMLAALTEANLQAHQLDYINAHGTATVMNDLGEARAIQSVFGESAVRVSSSKAQTGHLIAAAGAVEAIFAVMSLHEQVIPATQNLHEVDPDCMLSHVVGQAQSLPMQAVMSNSFGFGGSNSCLIFTVPYLEAAR